MKAVGICMSENHAHKYCQVYMGLAWLIITGSGLDDWICWHFFKITVNYSSSHIESFWTYNVCLNSLYEESRINL
jgi:hypothetical protein